MPGKPAQQDPAPYAPVIVAKSGRAIPQPHTADVLAILGIGCWVVAAVIGASVVFGYTDLVSSDYRIGEWFDSIGLGNAVLVKAATVWHYAGGPGGSFVLALVATVWLFIANRRGWALYVVVCGIGGLLGIALGIGAGLVVERFGMPVQFSSGPALLAFTCAFLTGVVFGYLPARKASRMNPVTALAFEGDQLQQLVGVEVRLALLRPALRGLDVPAGVVRSAAQGLDLALRRLVHRAREQPPGVMRRLP